MENLKNLLINKKILTVSHDIGGANIIKSYLEHHNIKSRFYLKGPALNIFKKKTRSSLLNNIKNADVVITGTGWKTNIEYDAIKISKKLNKICITFLDHWTNYKKRFIRDGLLVYPSIIVVFDHQSELNIKKIFTRKIKIFRVKNFYFSNFIKKIKYKKVLRKSILYLSSNYDDALKKNIDLILLNKFIKKINKSKKFKNFNIDIKPHPTENFIKYLEYKKNNFQIRKIITNKSLEQVISKYSIAAGTETSSLFLAKLCKLKTINNIYGVPIKRSLPSKYITLNI